MLTSSSSFVNNGGCNEVGGDLWFEYGFFFTNSFACFFFINFQPCNDGFRIVDRYFNFDIDFLLLGNETIFGFFVVWQ